MSRRRDKASSSMAAAAMSLVQLERWLQDRTVKWTPEIGPKVKV